jgi:hypothetical protein
MSAFCQTNIHGPFRPTGVENNFEDALFGPAIETVQIRRADLTVGYKAGNDFC